MFILTSLDLDIFAFRHYIFWQVKKKQFSSSWTAAKPICAKPLVTGFKNMYLSYLQDVVSLGG